MTKRTKKPPKHESHVTPALKNTRRTDGKFGARVRSSSPSWQDKSWVGVSVLFCAIYIKTTYPSVPGGDSGELIVAAYELGVAHPPGYPLFTILSKMAMFVLPFYTIAWRVNVLSAVCGALSVGVLHHIVYRLTNNAAAGLFSASLFGLSRLGWTWAVTSEVFSLNNLFVVLLMWVAVLFDQACDEGHKQMIVKYCQLGAFVCGLSLCNQHTVIVYVAIIVLWVLIKLYKHKVLSVRLVLSLAVYFSTGLLPYLYLPMSSYMNMARWTWGDQTDINGFLVHLLRREYGTFNLGKNEEGLGFMLGLRAYGYHVTRNLALIGPLCALLGTIIASRWRKSERQRVVSVFVIMLLVYMAFFAWRANLSLRNPLYKGVVERFWLQSDLVVTLLAGIGYDGIVKWVIVTAGTQSSRLKQLVPAAGALVIIMAQMQNKLHCDQSQNLVVHEFASTLLHNMPDNAVVFLKGDLPANSMRYLHLCENSRPDLKLVDVEVLSYEWSLRKLRKFYPQIDFPGDFWQLTNADWPDGRRSFNFKHLIDVNYARYPIITCIGMQEHDPTWMEGYELWPFGPCQRIMKKGSEMNPQDWANQTTPIAANWNYHFQKFEETSWEHVANGEMWHAKIGTAYFLFDQGSAVQSSAAAAILLLTSHQLYSQALEDNKELGFPDFWHKNLALVCERLLHHQTPLDPQRLGQQSIQHFQAYLHKNPDDEQTDSIKHAIQSIQKWLKTNTRKTKP